MSTKPNAKAIERWAGEEGELWVREAERFDAMDGPFGESMLDAARLQPGDRVLDVGCGNAANTIEAAGRVPPKGSILAVDISPPTLSLGRERAAAAAVQNIEFLEADAQTYPFEEHAFDVVISRFGTMFFDDPEAAFANIGRSVRPGGRLAIVCWQDIFQNEWIIVPGAAAAEHVGLPDFGPPGSPGPFAFADGDRLAKIIEAGGFSEVTLEAVTRPMWIGEDADDAVSFIVELAKRDLFEGKPEDKVAAAIKASREAIAPYAGPQGVTMNGTAWLASARR